LATKTNVSDTRAAIIKPKSAQFKSTMVIVKGNSIEVIRVIEIPTPGKVIDLIPILRPFQKTA